MSKPESIVLVIADGAGIGHYTCFFYENNNKLSMKGFKNFGLVSTHAIDDYVTDSAASATAIATGKKTTNGTLGQGPNGQKYKNILDTAKEKGWMTGVMTTANIGDATPAAFLVHTDSRKNYEDIDTQIMKNKNVDYLSGEISNLVSKTRQILNKIKKPFLLVIEEEDTDNAGHEKNEKLLLDSMKNIDNLVKYLLNYHKKNPNVLIILTSDHETGGVYYNEFGINFSMKYHSANFVPIWSIGPGSELFSGFMDNVQIGKNIFSLLKE